jgi:hypothetical protein
MASIGGLWSKMEWAKKQDPISRITKVKRAGSMANVSSNSSTTKKRDDNYQL